MKAVDVVKSRVLFGGGDEEEEQRLFMELYESGAELTAGDSVDEEDLWLDDHIVSESDTIVHTHRLLDLKWQSSAGEQFRSLYNGTRDSTLKRKKRKEKQKNYKHLHFLVNL